MTVYIILFRGVGGATQLPTKPLREALTKAGFKDVATYINSGNAVLSSRKGAASITAEIARIAKKEFGFDKAIHVVTREEWAEHRAQLEHGDRAGEDGRRDQVTVVANAAAPTSFRCWPSTPRARPSREPGLSARARSRCRPAT